MASPKHTSADRHRQYTLHRNIGIVLALLLLIAAFRVNIQADADPVNLPNDQDPPIQVVDLPTPTQHPDTPPAPPRPTPSYIAPSYDVIDDGTTFTNELPIDPDPGQAPESVPPPPEPESGERTEPFLAVEEMPELVGGRKALYDAVDYPEFARRTGIQGRVYVQFVVDETGQVREAEVVKGVHPLLDRAAIRAVEAMTFTPGRQRGRAVPVRMTLPIVFTIR